MQPPSLPRALVAMSSDIFGCSDWCCYCYVTSVMSDSTRPQRRQPTRLPSPWDSPGKNTGVGCHFLLQCMKVKSEMKSLSRVRLFATPWTAAYQAPPSMGFSRQEYQSGVPLPSLRLLVLNPPNCLPRLMSGSFSSVQSLSRVRLFATP